MYASSFENLNYAQKDEKTNILIYENELYKIDTETHTCYSVDLVNDYQLNKLTEHTNAFTDLLLQAQFVVYYDRTYSYRKYVSPLLYIAVLTNTIIMFDEQSDYEQCIVNHIFKDNKDLSKYIIVNEENCKEKKKVILSDENLLKTLLQIQRKWYDAAKTSKLSLYIKI